MLIEKCSGSFDDSKVKFAELFEVGCGRAVCHKFGSVLNFRECDNVTQAFCTEELHYKSVKTDAHAAVRRIKTEAGWTIDENIPIFKGDGREYVERFVYPKEDNT